MAFFDGVMNFVKKFREAAQAGADFNPLLESIEKQIEQLKAVLDQQYPERLTLPQQGSFELGYYHQKQKRFEKKEEQ